MILIALVVAIAIALAVPKALRGGAAAVCVVLKSGSRGRWSLAGTGLPVPDATVWVE